MLNPSTTKLTTIMLPHSLDEMIRCMRPFEKHLIRCLFEGVLHRSHKKQSKNVTRFLFYIYVKCQKHAIGHKSVQRQNQVMFGIIDVNKMQSKTLHSTESHLCDVFQMSEMFMHKYVFIEHLVSWNWMSKNQYDLRQLLRFGVFFFPK